jgi:hypothetical protein
MDEVSAYTEHRQRKNRVYKLRDLSPFSQLQSEEVPCQAPHGSSNTQQSVAIHTK